MAGRTGYTPVGAAMLGDEQITDVYEHFDPLVGESKPTAGDLPPTGNWPNRTILAEDTKTVYVWTGASWLPFDTEWLSYTPTRTNNSGGTLTAKYKRVGKQVFVVIRLVGGTISGNNPGFSLPVASADGAVQHLPGIALLRDDSASIELEGITRKMSSTTVAPYVIATSTPYAQFASVNGTTPFTWAANDVLEMPFYYESV